MGSLSRQEICSGLHYGYTIDQECIEVPHPIPNKIETSKERAIKKGNRNISSIFNKLINQNNSGNTIHVIPLSSGLDSRFILGELLKHDQVDQNQIRTISFGSPGNWDYDIPQQIASDIQIFHNTIDLTDSDFWDPEEIRDYAGRLTGLTRILVGFVNSQIHQKFPNHRTVYWSGFLSSELAGTHLPHMPSNAVSTWDEACDWFADREHRTSGDFSIPDFNPKSVLPDSPIVDAHPPNIRYEEQLDYGIRMQCFVRRTIKDPRFSDKIIEPFVHPTWVEYILSLSEELRANRNVFVELFKSRHPKLAEYPTDANYGLPISHSGLRREWRKYYTKFVQKYPNIQYLPNPNINLINFANALRDHPNLSALMASAANSFDKRGLFTNISARELLDAHNNGKNHTSGLLTILSLEMYLQTH